MEDFYGKEIKVGDEVIVENAWEDEAGQYHDEQLTIARVLPDGQLKFRFGHWKTRTVKECLLQAWINQFEWYADNCQKA